MSDSIGRWASLWRSTRTVSIGRQRLVTSLLDRILRLLVPQLQNCIFFVYFDDSYIAVTFLKPLGRRLVQKDIFRDSLLLVARLFLEVCDAPTCWVHDAEHLLAHAILKGGRLTILFCPL